MIWDNEKYKLAIEALGVMGWDGVDRYDDDLSAKRFSLRRHESGRGWIRWDEEPDGEFDDWTYVSDFEAGCILAEFVVNRLWNKHLVAVMPALLRDGFVWRIAERDNNRWEYMPGGYKDRHEALAEAMLAVLREIKERKNDA